jgi:hypothetical protein
VNPRIWLVMKIPPGTPSQRSSASSALLGGLPELLKQDEFAVYVREQLCSNGKFVGWVDKGGVLWLDGRPYIPANGCLRIALIRKHHDVPLASHLASARTLELEWYG